ncbi:hypothetical protein [Pseudomonas fragi]|uniref:hypothetical protein n=1 Tax=Pseudomonas fragi TaxID=296 RepID=UPI000BA1D77A|nr:hypothetical protein [Pseudomonas fragi]PAA10525.1 hypothetical protein CJU78_03965 [Pseudomonas fragi]
MNSPNQLIKGLVRGKGTIKIFVIASHPQWTELNAGIAAGLPEYVDVWAATQTMHVKPIPSYWIWKARVETTWLG